MKVLVTGGKGMIGSHVVSELTKAGHNIICFDLKDGQDIRCADAVRRYFVKQKPDMVVHLAAWPHPSTRLTYQHYVDTNIVGTFNVAEACAAAKIKRLVYTSSTAYYGYEHSIGRPTPIGDERTIPGIRWAESKEDKYLPCELWYGISKVCAETLLAYYGLAQRFQVVILRFAPVPKHINLSLPPERAAEAVRLAAEHEGDLWYEVFNIAGCPGLDISKAQKVLGFDPGFEVEEEGKEEETPAVEKEPEDADSD